MAAQVTTTPENTFQGDSGPNLTLTAEHEPLRLRIVEVRVVAEAENVVGLAPSHLAHVGDAEGAQGLVPHVSVHGAVFDKRLLAQAE